MKKAIYKPAILVCATVIFLSMSVLAKPSRERNVDIKHIRIHLFLETIFSTKRINGIAMITLSPLKKSSIVKLDAAFFTIKDIGGPKGKKFNYTYDSSDKNDNLVITLDREYDQSEELTLGITYQANWQNETDPAAIGGSNGKGIRFFEPTSGDQRRKFQIWSMAEYHSNRYWFPGYDDPEDVRTTEFIATVPDGFSVISNGQLISDTKKSSGYSSDSFVSAVQKYADQNSHTVHFKADKPYANHQTAFVIGKFTDVKQVFENIQLHNYSLTDEVDATKASVIRLPDMVKYFSRVTGVKYPYPEYGQVFVQDLPYGMDNITMATQTENMVDDYGTHADYFYLWDPLEAEALARNWFGGYVTSKDWSEVWLNRAFPLYFDRLYNEYKNGKEEVLLYPLLFDHSTWLSDWNSGIRHPIVTKNYDNEAGFVTDNYSYTRGQLVLHMLRKELGDERWWKAIRYYLRENANKQVTTGDFQKAVEKAAGKSMTWFFDQWIYKTGHPVFEVTKQYDETKKQLVVTVQQIQMSDSAGIYPQIKFFRGKMDMEIDNRIENIWIEPRAKNRYVFHAISNPRLVNFDFERAWIKEVKFEKTFNEWLYQFQNSRDIVARRFALNELAGLAKKETTTNDEKTKILEAFKKTILSNAYWRFRWNVLSQMQGIMAGAGTPRLEKPVVDMLLTVINKERSWMRFAAIGFLGTTKDSAYQDIYLKHLYDSSDRVVYASAIALGKTKSSKAFDALIKLPGRPSWKKQSLISSLIGLKELGDPRGFAMAMKSLNDVTSPRWTLTTPLWDYQIQAAQTIVALDSAKVAYPFVFERFKRSVEENSISDIFTSLYLITTLADERGQEAFDMLKVKYKDDSNAMTAINQQEEQFRQSLKK